MMKSNPFGGNLCDKVLMIVPPVLVGIDGDDDVDGIDHPRDVSENRQQKADTELHSATAIAEEDAEWREKNGDEDLQESAGTI